jgi:hypothetical protein
MNVVRLADDRFEQGRFERQHGVAAGTRAFGKQHDEVTVLEELADLLRDLAHLTPPLAPHEDGATQRRKPAPIESWPSGTAGVLK